MGETVHLVGFYFTAQSNANSYAAMQAQGVLHPDLADWRSPCGKGEKHEWVDLDLDLCEPYGWHECTCIGGPSLGEGIVCGTCHCH